MLLLAEQQGANLCVAFSCCRLQCPAGMGICPCGMLLLAEQQGADLCVASMCCRPQCPAGMGICRCGVLLPAEQEGTQGQLPQARPFVKLLVTVFAGPAALLQKGVGNVRPAMLLSALHLLWQPGCRVWLPCHNKRRCGGNMGHRRTPCWSQLSAHTEEHALTAQFFLQRLCHHYQVHKGVAECWIHGSTSDTPTQHIQFLHCSSR
jgi:hypothetical protein